MAQHEKSGRKSGTFIGESLSSQFTPLICKCILQTGERSFEIQIAYHVEGMVNKDPSQIMLPGISQITARAGEEHVEHVLFNPEGNPCYFKFHLVRNDTGEELYTSGLVEPGNAVMEFDLTEPLEAGSYEVTVQVETHPVDDPEGEMNQGAIKTTLVVE